MALTAKQEKFCQNIVKGMTYKDAYIDAYNSKGCDQNAYNEGSKLMLREDIQQRVKVLSKPLEEIAQQQALTEREKKRAVLWNIINTGSPADQCRAMDILNKMDMEYTQVNITKTDSTVNLAKVDLDMLKSLTE